MHTLFYKIDQQLIFIIVEYPYVIEAGISIAISLFHFSNKKIDNLPLINKGYFPNPYINCHPTSYTYYPYV